MFLNTEREGDMDIYRYKWIHTVDINHQYMSTRILLEIFL